MVAIGPSAIRSDCTLISLARMSFSPAGGDGAYLYLPINKVADWSKFLLNPLYQGEAGKLITYISLVHPEFKNLKIVTSYVKQTL